MSVLDTMYVLDTNTLVQLKVHRRASQFFRERVRIPSDVLDEARGLGDIDALRGLRYPTTADVLRQVTRVMATVEPTDSSLVDLYAGLGGADPFVIACALDGRDREGDLIVPTEWIVVTGDKAVSAKAEEFDLRVLSNADFAALIDDSENPRSPDSARSAGSRGVRA